METEVMLPNVSPEKPQSSASLPATQTISAEAFSLLWAKMTAANPREKEKFNDATMEVYYEQLCTYSEAQITDAVSGCLSRCKFFPAISELISEIKGQHHCPHALIRAQLRMERERLESDKKVVREYERYTEQKVDQLAKKCAELESRSVELYLQDKKNIEESGLPEAQKKLDELQSQIFEYDRTLQTIRAKIRILDQARLIQLTEKEKSWNGRTNA